MKPTPPACASDPAFGTCGPTSSVEELNRDCYCPGVDRSALHDKLEDVLRAHGLPAALADSHPHLFAVLPVFVARRQIEAMAAVVSATAHVVALPSYQAAALAWAPDIARFDPGSPGGLLGFDFHLTAGGPKLIEINTNPGGALINVLAGQAQQVCMPESMQPVVDSEQAEQSVLDSMLMEWHLQRGAARLGSIAIVDESPRAQYLYAEFALYQELFRRHGYRAVICDPRELVRQDGRLWHADVAVDLVYNRLTDFALEQPSHAYLRAAYLAREVAMSPHPRAHALFADKRNLTLLGDGDFLRAQGVLAESVSILTRAIPRTQVLTAANRDAMWALRRDWFFKPAAGFGSKASYRGDKLTRRVWEEISAASYVAQQVVAPSERRLASGSDPLKVDIRCYAYAGKPVLYAARIYQGQTTNFRTPGGGFAPVLTSVRP